jgi:fructosamine-3-kinase
VLVVMFSCERTASSALQPFEEDWSMNADTKIEQLTGHRPAALEPLRGGCIGTVRRARMPSGGDLVVKTGDESSKLSIEGQMLGFLGEHSALPVPEVLHSADELLIMEFIDSSGQATTRAHIHAAELLAELHTHTDGAYGFDQDTLIGKLDQPNPQYNADQHASWVDFFAEHRLMSLAERCVQKGQMPGSLGDQIEKLVQKLDRYIDRPNPPALIHGDVWGGNVLFDGDQVAGFVDPAIYYADPEIELAFTTLFSTFDDAFYDRYDELNGIRDGFWDVRKDLYNIYPLLVHVWHFGGSYVESVRSSVGRFV